MSSEYLSNYVNPLSKPNKRKGSWDEYTRSKYVTHIYDIWKGNKIGIHEKAYGQMVWQRCFINSPRLLSKPISLRWLTSSYRRVPTDEFFWWDAKFNKYFSFQKQWDQVWGIRSYRRYYVSGWNLRLPQLILEIQSIFVSGRLISDKILIAQKMLYWLRTM